MLKENEIETLITKLRNKYSDYAAAYSSRWFNIDDFEERLQTALRNSIDMQAFIVAEIAHFEKIHERYQHKQGQKSFSKKVDALIQEMTAKIVKYPKIEFSPKAHFEIMHMYGACNELLELYFPVLWMLRDNRSKLYEFEQQLNYLCARFQNKESKRIQVHINLINRLSIKPIEIEKDKNEYLKECAFILHEIDTWLGVIISPNTPDQPLMFAGLHVHQDKKKKILSLFQHDTRQSALQRIHHFIRGIIEDFRLQSFKKN